MKKSKSEVTKDIIYTNAISLFQKIGYEKTTMRLISSKAGIALGAAYYYFKTKDEIVFQFYLESQEVAKKQSVEFNETTKSFEKRIKNIIIHKIEYFTKYEKLISVLAENAANPKHPLSPFSKETKNIREEAISIIKDSMIDSDIKLNQELKEELPFLLWLYQMAIIFYWIKDESINKEKTFSLIESSLKLLIKLLQLTRLPFMKSILKQILEVIKIGKI